EGQDTQEWRFMHEDKWLAEQFDAQRARLRVVAYRMLGSPFLLLQRKVISRPFSRCSIRMSYSEPTTQPFKRPQRIKLAERRACGVRSKATTPSPRRSRDARERHNLRSSTVSPEPSGLRVENHGSFSFLRFGPTRSWQSI